MRFEREKVLKTLLVTLQVLLGAGISAAAIDFFLVPHKLLPGGVSGAAILISYLTHLPPGVYVALLNIPLFLIAWHKIDLKFCIYSLIGTVAFAIGLDAFSFLSSYSSIQNPLLASVYGGVISGAGTGFVLRARGCLGGTDIISVILRRRYSMSIGMVCFFINVVIVSILSLRFGVELGLLTLFAQYIGARTVDQVVMGFGTAKSMMIVSDKSEEISKYIMKELYRGVTFLHGEGAFERTPKDVIWCVVTTPQLARIKSAVRKIDSGAFIAIFSASEIIGRGFYKSPF